MAPDGVGKALSRVSPLERHGQTGASAPQHCLPAEFSASRAGVLRSSASLERLNFLMPHKAHDHPAARSCPRPNHSASRARASPGVYYPINDEARTLDEILLPLMPADFLAEKSLPLFPRWDDLADISPICSLVAQMDKPEIVTVAEVI